jgi:cytochrome c-type biogenesis protein CcmE
MVQTDTARPRARRRLKWAVGGVLIVCGLGGLAAWAIASPGAVSYYVTPSQVAVQGSAVMGHQLRVGGRVGELVRDGTNLRFTVTDGHNAVRVVYHGDVPDTLKVGTDAVADGTLRPDGTLVATRVLAKCSSKFAPKDAKRPY